MVDGVAEIVGRRSLGHVYVDGNSVGDVGHSTLSDRLILGEGGFISISVAIDNETAAPSANPRSVAAASPTTRRPCPRRHASSTGHR